VPFSCTLLLQGDNGPWVRNDIVKSAVGCQSRATRIIPGEGLLAYRIVFKLDFILQAGLPTLDVVCFNESALLPER
jgi:hypothetical protein